MPAVNPARRASVRALLALLLTPVLAGLVGGAGALTTTTAASAATQTATSVRSSAATIDWGRRATVVIRVYDSAGHALGGARVRVYRHTSSGNVYVTRVTTSTSTRVARFHSRGLHHDITYVLVHPGTTAYGRSSHAQRVDVRSFGASLVHVGARKKGSPYQYGADGPYRFDCSGFTRWVAARFGRYLAHSSSTQYGEVRHISKSNRRVGDLVFLHDSSGHVYHVGFYAGNGRLLAATHSGDYVRLETLWTSSYYVGRLHP